MFLVSLESPFRKLRKNKNLVTLSGLNGERLRLDGLQAPDVSRAKEDFFTDKAWEDRIARETGDRRLAQRVSRLKLRHPYGTVPELITLDWLEARNERYVFQTQLYGGWVKGGLIPDFVLNARRMAWNIMGDYWHTLEGKPQRDESDRLRMLGSYVDGVKIERVVFIWESQLMRNRQRVLEDALAGIEHRQ